MLMREAVAADDRNDTEIIIYEGDYSDDATYSADGSVLALWILDPVQENLCLNLEDLFAGNQARGNTASGEDSDLVRGTYRGIHYLRSPESYNASRLYADWRVWQYPLVYNETNLDIPGPVQVNVYGEGDCRNDSRPYYAYSCRRSYEGPSVDWSAKSISLQPHDEDAGNCLNIAKNGDPEEVYETPGSENLGEDDADDNGAGGRSHTGICATTAAIAMAFAVAVVL